MWANYLFEIQQTMLFWTRIVACEQGNCLYIAFGEKLEMSLNFLFMYTCTRVLNVSTSPADL